MRAIFRNGRGWVVLTWSKMGSLLVFMGMMLMMLTAFSFSNSSAQADAANELSRTLKNLIMDTYDSTGGMSFEYRLPDSLNGDDYSVEILDKPGDMAGIITRTGTGLFEIAGASSLSIPLSNSSFGLLRGFRGSLNVCITKYNSMIYLENSKCE